MENNKIQQNKNLLESVTLTEIYKILCLMDIFVE